MKKLIISISILIAGLAVSCSENFNNEVKSSNGIDMGNGIELKFDSAIKILAKGKKYYASLSFDHKQYSSKNVFITSLDCIISFDKEKDRYSILSNNDSAKIMVVVSDTITVDHMQNSRISPAKMIYFK